MSSDIITIQSCLAELEEIIGNGNFFLYGDPRKRQYLGRAGDVGRYFCEAGLAGELRNFHLTSVCGVPLMYRYPRERSHKSDPEKGVFLPVNIKVQITNFASSQRCYATLTTPGREDLVLQFTSVGTCDKKLIFPTVMRTQIQKMSQLNEKFSRLELLGKLRLDPSSRFSTIEFDILNHVVSGYVARC